MNYSLEEFGIFFRNLIVLIVVIYHNLMLTPKTWLNQSVKNRCLVRFIPPLGSAKRMLDIK